MGFRRKHLLERQRSPEIEAAFRSYPPEHDAIRGQPSLDDLKARSIRSLHSEGYCGAMDAVLGVKSVRGVTIEISVTIVDGSGVPLSVCSWKAGQGVSFEILRRLN